MKAQVLKKQGPLESNSLIFEELEVPTFAFDEVLIKVLACGMCLTDRHIIEGDILAKKLPLIPGHQIVGLIEKIGSGVKNYKIGQRVGVFWLAHTCETCMYCTHHQENLCEKAQFTGYDVNGGYAEYAVAKADYLVALPEEIDPIKLAPLLCSGIVGYRSYRLADISPGGMLGIFGFGAAAYLTLQVARSFNVKVSVFTRSEKHQDLAKKMGAVWVGSSEESPPFLLDSAIIFAPNGSLVPKALSVLRRGGTLAINAIHTSDIPSFPYQLIYHEKVCKSVANATREDASLFLDLAVKIPLQTNVKVYPLRDANQALLDHKHSKIETSIVFVP